MKNLILRRIIGFIIDSLSIYSMGALLYISLGLSNIEYMKGPLFFLGLVYLTICYIINKSFGLILMKLKLISFNNEKPNFWQYFLRASINTLLITFYYMIPLYIMFLGILSFSLMAFFSWKERKIWFIDEMTKSTVVNAKTSTRP